MAEPYINKDFDVIKTSKTYKARTESLCITWEADFSKLVPDYFVGAEEKVNQFKYIPSGCHIGGYSIQNPCEWCIQLNPAYLENGQRFISVFLWLHKFLRKNVEPEDQSVRVSYVFQLLDPTSGLEQYSKASSIHTFSVSRPCYGFKKFIPYPSKVDEGTTARRVLCVRVLVKMMENIDNSFIIPCTLKDITESSEESAAIVGTAVTETGDKKFQNEIDKRRNIFFVNHSIKYIVEKMYKFSEGSDIIVASSTEQFPAHVNVLQARSISRCFSNKGGVIDMKHLPSLSVRALLDYCYLDYSLNFISYVQLKSIRETAVMYQMNSLVAQCMVEMACTLKPKYFIHFAHLASQRQTDDLNLKPFLASYFLLHQPCIKQKLTPQNKEFMLKIIQWLFFM